MVRGDLYERGLFLFTNGSDLAEAAGMEAAAGRGIDGAGHHAFQDDARSTVFLVHDGDGRQQGLGVRMLGVGEEVFGRCLLDNLAQVHHRHKNRWKHTLDVLHTAFQQKVIQALGQSWWPTLPACPPPATPEQPVALRPRWEKIPSPR